MSVCAWFPSQTSIPSSAPRTDYGSTATLGKIKIIFISYNVTKVLHWKHVFLETYIHMVWQRGHGRMAAVDKEMAG